VLLVLDATTGQNAIQQAAVFTEGIGVTGLVLTKLDGTAKGGVVLAIRREVGLPVKWVGLGEKMDDLEPFDADAFLAGLLPVSGVEAGTAGDRSGSREAD
ncbi:MAG: signal recognition particle-docking protein FtsY, partial [Planctomycetota bacterium]|nr:signal recognition particle-docking protein FtsY [Planctomycetota bacterium]